MESIKTELNLTTGKRQELERRLQHAQEEKESITSSLEEASDRIHMLERHAREQETKLEVSSERKRDVITSIPFSLNLNESEIVILKLLEITFCRFQRTNCAITQVLSNLSLLLSFTVEIVLLKFEIYKDINHHMFRPYL